MLPTHTSCQRLSIIYTKGHDNTWHERKKERKTDRQTPEANKKNENELPQVGFEPTTGQGQNQTSHTPV